MRIGEVSEPRRARSSAAKALVYELGAFRLRAVGEGVPPRDGAPVKLSPKALETLATGK